MYVGVYRVVVEPVTQSPHVGAHDVLVLTIAVRVAPHLSEQRFVGHAPRREREHTQQLVVGGDELSNRPVS